jgi:hypothetical protein
MSAIMLTPVDPTPDEVQYLEDRIDEFNPNVTDIADGELLAFFVREIASSGRPRRGPLTAWRSTSLSSPIVPN